MGCTSRASASEFRCPRGGLLILAEQLGLLRRELLLGQHALLAERSELLELVDDVALRRLAAGGGCW